MLFKRVLRQISECARHRRRVSRLTGYPGFSDVSPCSHRHSFDFTAHETRHPSHAVIPATSARRRSLPFALRGRVSTAKNARGRL